MAVLAYCFRFFSDYVIEHSGHDVLAWLAGFSIFDVGCCDFVIVTYFESSLHLACYSKKRHSRCFCVILHVLATCCCLESDSDSVGNGLAAACSSVGCYDDGELQLLVTNANDGLPVYYHLPSITTTTIAR